MADRQTRVYRFGIIPVGVLIIAVAVGFTEFRYESEALLWHLIHGSTYQWQGLIIPVPLMYDLTTGGSSNSIQVVTRPGRLRARRKAPFGVMTAIRAQNQAEGSKIEDIDKKIAIGLEKHGFRLTGSRSIEVAGKQMQCQERLAENFRSYGSAFVVNCQVEDKLLFVEFYGSASLLNEFYSLASAIKGVNAK